VSLSKNQTPNSKLYKGKSPNKTDILDASGDNIYLG